MSRDSEARKVGLPIRPFMYTLDQVADMLGLTLRGLKLGYVYFDGVHSGKPPLDKLTARNIAPQGEKDEFRIAERELIRWLKRTGFRVTDASSSY